MPLRQLLLERTRWLRGAPETEKAGEAELIIAKQRNGPTGDVALTFRKELTRFEDRAREEREPI